MNSPTVSSEQLMSHIAEGAKLSVIPHGGSNQAYGQHFSCAVTNVPMIEFFVGSSPGIPLDETIGIPGTVVPKDGYILLISCTFLPKPHLHSMIMGICTRFKNARLTETQSSYLVAIFCPQNTAEFNLRKPYEISFLQD